MITIFYHRVTSIDCSIMTPTLGPVGVSYWVDVEFQGELGADGVIVDFALAKKQAKTIIDNLIDHHFIVAKNQGTWAEAGAQLIFEGKFGKDHLKTIFYQAPRHSFLIMPAKAIEDASSVQDFLALTAADAIKAQLPAQVQQVKVHLCLGEHEAQANMVKFAYTHGLKKHLGHCQQMLHGHQGALIFTGVAAADVAQEVQSLLPTPVHFSAWDEVVNQQELLAKFSQIDRLGGTCPGMDVEMAYQGSQGDFRLKLPGAQVYLLPDAPTIENLAIYWQRRMAERSSSALGVTAYEGLGKGATAN
jgi:6-pyruvoyl-tetrahydropterin synthase